MSKYGQSHRFRFWGTLFNPVEGVTAPLGEIRVGGPGRAALPASLSVAQPSLSIRRPLLGARGGDSSPPQRRFLLAQPPYETLRGTTGLAGAGAVGRRRGWLCGPLNPSGHRPGRWALGGLSSSRAKAAHWFPYQVPPTGWLNAQNCMVSQLWRLEVQGQGVSRTRDCQ